MLVSNNRVTSSSAVPDGGHYLVSTIQTPPRAGDSSATEIKPPAQATHGEDHQRREYQK
jgi:hypothetical protein